MGYNYHGSRLEKSVVEQVLRKRLSPDEWKLFKGDENAYKIAWEAEGTWSQITVYVRNYLKNKYFKESFNGLLEQA